MSKIVYFCSPDIGHAEPTLELVHELIRRGHEVVYYGFDNYREYIDKTSATYISCNKYLDALSLTPRQVLSLSADLTEAFPRLAEITLAMDAMLCETFTASRPDCIIADTAAIWGKAIAIKLNIPYICSMTSFALNRYSSRLMRTTPAQKVLRTVSKTMSMRVLHKLQENGYPIQNMTVLLPDDGVSNTLVFSSRAFHPASETFPDNYHFVGFHLEEPPVSVERESSKLIYISMGTLNNMKDFYRVCVEAFRGQNINVVMSTARSFPPNELGTLPGNIYARSYVDQKVALQNADLFICHGGMSSVNESLYFGVPMLLFPQTTEQRGVSRRIVELKCGTVLHKDDMITIRNAASNILENDSFRKNAAWVSDTFRMSGGGAAAAEVIEGEILKHDMHQRKLAMIAAKKQAARDLEEAKFLAKQSLRREKEATEIAQEMALAMEALAESVKEIESQLSAEELAKDPKIAADLQKSYEERLAENATEMLPKIPKSAKKAKADSSDEDLEESTEQIEDSAEEADGPVEEVDDSTLEIDDFTEDDDDSTVEIEDSTEEIDDPDVEIFDYRSKAKDSTGEIASSVEATSDQKESVAETTALAAETAQSDVLDNPALESKQSAAQDNSALESMQSVAQDNPAVESRQSAAQDNSADEATSGKGAALSTGKTDASREKTVTKKKKSTKKSKTKKKSSTASDLAKESAEDSKPAKNSSEDSQISQVSAKEADGTAKQTMDSEPADDVEKASNESAIDTPKARDQAATSDSSAVPKKKKKKKKKITETAGDGSSNKSTAKVTKDSATAEIKARPQVDVITSTNIIDSNPLETVTEENREKFSIFGPSPVQKAATSDESNFTEAAPVRYNAFHRPEAENTNDDQLTPEGPHVKRKKKKHSSRPTAKRPPVDASNPEQFKKAVISDLKAAFYRKNDPDDE